MKYILLLTALLTSTTIAAATFDETMAEAKQGEAYAQYNLGVMYDNGEGVPENSIRAYVWWSMAKIQGHTGAAGNLDILKPRMTKQQIAQAQALAAKCYESDYKDCD